MCFLYDKEINAFLNVFKVQDLLFHCPQIIAKIHSVVFAVPLQTFRQKKRSKFVLSPQKKGKEPAAIFSLLLSIFISSSPNQHPRNLSTMVHKTACHAGFLKCCEPQHSNHSSGVRFRMPPGNGSSICPRRQGNKPVSLVLFYVLFVFFCAPQTRNREGSIKV